MPIIKKTEDIELKVVFCSNYLNHHQLPFSLAMMDFKNIEYYFIATERTEKNRLSMGYKDMNKLYPWVVESYKSEEEKMRAIRLAEEADVVITGSAPDYLIKSRLKKNKLTFRYSERLYKKGTIYRWKPRSIVGQFLHHTRYKRKKLYMLCASAFTSYDFSFWGNYKNKCFKWGYFPEIEKKDIEELYELKQNNRKIEILWAGRMLQWKHPEYAIYAAKHLKGKRREFHLTMIGDGDQAQTIKKLAEENGVAENVDFLGFMPPEKVREYMQKADIFLFTSDFNEGWGAVLNESMGSACAVVASHAIGSVPFLLKDGENGMIYTYGNVNEFCEKTDKLVTDQVLRNKLQRKAYETIFNEWNANIAAKRLIELSEALLKGQPLPDYDTGPCSRAEILKNNWFLRNKQ